MGRKAIDYTKVAEMKCKLCHEVKPIHHYYTLGHDDSKRMRRCKNCHNAKRYANRRPKRWLSVTPAQIEELGKLKAIGASTKTMARYLKINHQTLGYWIKTKKLIF